MGISGSPFSLDFGSRVQVRVNPECPCAGYSRAGGEQIGSASPERELLLRALPAGERLQLALHRVETVTATSGICATTPRKRKREIRRESESAKGAKARNGRQIEWGPIVSQMRNARLG
jgi:hypothetical protein